ncbi:MAG: autotransporter domain-containing protein [Hyphomicrobiaceae bacterium]|nr:autotransporter domain-containing protein [Hyphomicrobiaceae bacterium]
MSATDPGGRVISFGDSLSDNGNLKAQTGNPPSPYYLGRFSNGPVWTELLNGPMNSPVQGTGVSGNVNLAFGGARADNAVNLNGPIPSIGSQIGTFLFYGGTFGTKDVVTIQGGANDIFQFFAVSGFANNAATTTAATTAAGALMGDIGLAIGAGAKTLLVPNLPDLGITPSYSAAAASAAAGTLATTSYNAAWQTGLVTLANANQSVNIIQMDVATLVKLAVANPTAFGLSNVTQACLSVLACATGSTATQNGYLFWDSVHPTSTAQQLQARFALLLLNADIMAQAVSPTSEVNLNARKQSTDETFERVSQWAYGAIARQNGFYATASGSIAHEGSNGATPAYNASLANARIGFDRQVGAELYGLAGAVSIGSLSSSPGLGYGGYKADLSMLHLDAYAAKHWGNVYLTGSVGGSVAFIDGRRDTGLPTVTATGNTRGSSAAAAVETGVMLKAGDVTFVPAARIAYIHSTINGFSESAPLLAMSYTDHTFDGLVGSLKLRAITPVAFGFVAPGRAYAEVAYESYLTARDGGYVGALINNTAHPFQVSTTDPIANGLNLKFGLEGKISPTATLTAQYGIGFQDGQGQFHTASVRLKVPF